MKNEKSGALIRETTLFGYFARVYYVEADDSFLLDWRMPDKDIGRREYTSPDDVHHEYRKFQDRLKHMSKNSGVDLGGNSK